MVSHCSKSQDIAKEVGDKAGEGNCYGGLGICYHRLADFKLAIEYLEHDLIIAKEKGYKARQAQAKCNLGNVFHITSD